MHTVFNRVCTVHNPIPTVADAAPVIFLRIIRQRSGDYLVPKALGAVLTGLLNM